MEIPISWIADYVDIEMGPDELASALTRAGLETVNLGSSVPDLPGVITARIEKIDKHPDADKLTVCKVRTADDAEPLNIVCGAPNINEGDIVPLATVGTKFPNGTKLKKTKIRGVTSQGMMCSEAELGISDDHTGIWILPADTPIGKQLQEALPSADSIIETEPTPNRADLYCVIGVARDIAAITEKKSRLPEFELIETGPPIADLAGVRIEDYDACPRYAARLIKGIKIGPSPEWMKKRLEDAGMRPINNVVDVTNYVMLELGQPLHAFDFNKLRQKRIVVKRAAAGDKFTTLDNEERVLFDDTLMICDGEGPVAIAGVMGGLESEVSQNTSDVFIESAYFKPTSVRRTARLLGIPSEASRKFDKGVDPLGTVFAVDRAAALMRELAGGDICKGVIDAKKELYEKKQISLRPKRTNTILGISLSPDEQKDLLSRLDGMEVREKDTTIEVVAPSYRPDLVLEVDLIEEIARLVGFDSIPATMPKFRMEPMRRKKNLMLAKKIREQLCALGFSEVVITSFEDPRRLGALGLAESDPRLRAVTVANPLSENESILRTTLIPKIVNCLVSNRSHGATGPIRLFEINVAFEDSGNGLPRERTMLSAVISPPLEKSLWRAGCKLDGFYDIKGVVEQILGAVGFPGARIEPDPDHETFLHPGKCARLMMGDSCAGKLGEIHPAVAAELELKQEAFLFEFQFDMLCEHADYVPKAKAISKFPSALRDIAVVVDEAVTMGDIIRAAMKIKSPALESMSVFDVFKGGNIPPAKKSMAFHVKYQSLERTLTDDEVNREHERLTKELGRKLGAALR